MEEAALVKKLLSGETVESASEEPISPLLLACHYGLVDVLSVIIAKGADVNTPDSCGFTPLYIAAYKGHTEVVRMLLEAQVNVDDGNITPLVAAAENGHSDVVKLLLDHGADLNIVIQPDQLTVYDIAATAEIQELILKAIEARNQDLCAVCWEVPVNSSCRFVPCGHNIVCKACNTRMLEKRIRNCPMCRSLIWCRAQGVPKSA